MIVARESCWMLDRRGNDRSCLGRVAKENASNDETRARPRRVEVVLDP